MLYDNTVESILLKDFAMTMMHNDFANIYEI